MALVVDGLSMKSFVLVMRGRKIGALSTFGGGHGLCGRGLRLWFVAAWAVEDSGRWWSRLGRARGLHIIRCTNRGIALIVGLLASHRDGLMDVLTYGPSGL